MIIGDMKRFKEPDNNLPIDERAIFKLSIKPNLVFHIKEKPFFLPYKNMIEFFLSYEKYGSRITNSPFFFYIDGHIETLWYYTHGYVGKLIGLKTKDPNVFIVDMEIALYNDWLNDDNFKTSRQPRNLLDISTEILVHP